MKIFVVIFWIVLGFAQIFAFLDGLHLWLGISSWLGLILFFITASIPFGPLIDACISYYGAHSAWHWEWWQAALLAFPFACLGIILNGLGWISRFVDRKHRKSAWPSEYS